MNRSVSEHTVTVAGEQEVSRERSLSDWLVAVALIAYPLLNFGLGMGNVWLLISFAGAGLGYALAVYLYRGIPGLVCRHRWMIAGVAAVIGLVLGVLVTPSRTMLMFVVTMVTIVATGAVVGWRANIEHSPLRLYLYGLAVVTVGAVAIWAPQWPLLIEGIKQTGPQLVEDFRSMGSVSGLSADEMTQLQDQTIRMVNFVAHLLPAGSIMTVIMQYSIGFLWFLSRDSAMSARPYLAPKPFIQWRVPFGVMPALLVFGLVRVFGGDTGKLIGDNVLFALSIYYCIGGLALVQSVWQKVGLSTLFKILFYVLLTFTGLIGYIGMVLLGFLDSFFDWRTPRENDAQAT